MISGIKHENYKFWVISLQHVSGLKVVVNRPRTPKQREIAHENGHKTRKLRVFSHISQKCNGSYMPCKSNWNQKPWAITHKNGHKHEKDEFLGITLKHVSGLKAVVNRPRTPKLWAIAHEIGHKTRERRVSGHNSQTCQVLSRHANPDEPKNCGQ